MLGLYGGACFIAEKGDQMNAEKMKTDLKVQSVGRLMQKHILGDELDANTRLKLKINNLLWEEMPEKTTIGQADAIACKIFMLMRNEYNDENGFINR